MAMRAAVCVASLVLAARAGSFRVSGSPAAARAELTNHSYWPTPPVRLLQYTLPPDKLEKAYALYLLNGTLYFVTTAWSFLVLYLMLRTKFGVRLRNLATTPVSISSGAGRHRDVGVRACTRIDPASIRRL